MSRFMEQQFIQNLRSFHQGTKGPLENECGTMRLLWKQNPDEKAEIKYTTHGIFFIPEAFGYDGSLSWMVSQALNMYHYRKNSGAKQEIAFLFENADVTGTEMVEIVKEVGNLHNLNEEQLNTILRATGHNTMMSTRYPRFQLLTKTNSSLGFITNTCDTEAEWWLFKAIQVPRDIKGDILDGIGRTVYKELHRYDGMPNVNSVIAVRGYTIKDDNIYMQILRRPHTKLIFEDLYCVKDRED